MKSRQQHRALTQSILLALASTTLALTTAHADTFGTGPNTFTIDFVPIGNAGNGADEGAGGGLYSSPYGGVPYAYRMGTYEISQDTIDKATGSGLTNVVAGFWTANQPAVNMTWYEAAAFVNWLNTSTGHQAAYNLNFDVDWSMSVWSSTERWQLGGENLFRHKDTYYFLPSEDEWYKAAFHKNDGVTANYWDYATGSNTVPTAVVGGMGDGTAVYNDATDQPAAVDSAGGLSAYGTMGQNGNVREWTESLPSPFWTYESSPDDPSSEDRVLLGGMFMSTEDFLRSSYRDFQPPFSGNVFVGFRVASVPEPSSALLLTGAGLGLLLRRRRKAGTVGRLCQTAAGGMASYGIEAQRRWPKANALQGLALGRERGIVGGRCCVSFSPDFPDESPPDSFCCCAVAGWGGVEWRGSL